MTACLALSVRTLSPLQTDTANASIDRPTAIKNNSNKPIFLSSSVVYPAENRHKKRPICRVEQISLVISCKTRGASSPVCWLCRAAERSAPTTPLLRFILAYAQPKVNMRAKLLPYANRKADTETAAQAVRCARTAQAVRPVRAGSFAVNHSGDCRYARQAHKRVDNLRFSTLL